LSFPFQAECVAARKSSPLKLGERVAVIEMRDEDDDELREMKVLVKWEGRTFSVPLVQLKGLDVDEATAEAIADWHYWVAQGMEF
jgi:hypothetical protein